MTHFPFHCHNNRLVFRAVSVMVVIKLRFPRSSCLKEHANTINEWNMDNDEQGKPGEFCALKYLRPS